MQASDIVASAYLRKDGSKGIRNKVLVVFTVKCSMHVCQKISEHFQSIGQDVEAVGIPSCQDNQVTIRRLLRYSTHPNVGAVLAVGLGCECVRPDRIAEYAKEQGRFSDWFYLQKVGGTKKGIELGIRIVEGMLNELEKTERVPLYVSDLVIGGECGGSDFTSGLAGNALVGNLFDRLVDSGGYLRF
jgi:altronate hydrolase